MEPKIELHEMGVGMLRDPETGETIKVLTATVTISLPFDVATAKGLADALTATAVQVFQPGDAPNGHEAG